MRVKKTDLSGGPRTNLPKKPELDLVLYHWSPTTNRNSINKIGLNIGRPTLQGNWRPPYVCFSDEPNLAWALSGRMWPDIPSWDLWMLHTPSQTSFGGYEIIFDTYRNSTRHYVKEYRIYSRVFKRDLIYVATRTQ